MNFSSVSSVFMFPQAGMHSVKAMQHIVYHSPSVGYWVVSDVIPDLLSKSERLEWEILNSQLLGFDEMDLSEQDPIPAFASVEDVIAWATAMDAITAIDDDIRAFKSPAECGTRFYRAAEVRIAEIEMRSVGKVPTEIIAMQCN